MKRILASLAATAMLASPAVADGLQLQPGLWENTVSLSLTFDLYGQTITLPAQTTVTQACVTGNSAEFSVETLAEQGCSSSNFNQNGQSASVDLVCLQEGTQLSGSMSLDIAESGASSSGSLSIDGVSTQYGDMYMTGVISGQRLSGC